MSVDVLIEDERWSAVDPQDLAARAIDATLVHLGLDPDDWDVAILAADDARIAGLNADFRGKPAPTNVLSWPTRERAAAHDGGVPELPDVDGDRELGDMALAFETCAAEAAAARKPLGDHVSHLIVHGLLHLLGYDHIRERDGDLMESRETAILATLGIADPYG